MSALGQRQGVDSIVFFGSAARGDDDDDSDYDFCVDARRIRDYDDLAHFVRETEDAMKTEVDVITLGGVRSDSRLMQNIRRDGIIVYSRTA